MAQYVIGVDFGSLSGRAVLVDSRTGQIAAQRTVPYAHGVMTEGGAGWALHHPADYLDVLETAVPQVLRDASVPAEQVAAIGWDVTAYVAVCAILCLPVVYLLRSIAALVVYDLSLLYWTAAGGPLNTLGGTALLWILLLLAVPFYDTLITMRDERRLSIFSWVMTITVFAAFGLAARSTDYIPFLMLGSLAVTIMLVGYSIDIHQSWGAPFRWFGRFAAAGSLLISCLPAAWDGIARVHAFHWVTALVTLVLFAVMIALMAQTVKNRLWGPVLYLAVPFILAFETILVRAGLYSSIPLVLSSLYMVVLGFFETSQGFKPGHSLHMKFGVVIFISRRPKRS